MDNLLIDINHLADGRAIRRSAVPVVFAQDHLSKNKNSFSEKFQKQDWAHTWEAIKGSSLTSRQKLQKHWEYRWNWRENLWQDYIRRVISEPLQKTLFSPSTMTIQGLANLPASLPPTTRRILDGCLVVPQSFVSRVLDPSLAPRTKLASSSTTSATKIFML